MDEQWSGLFWEVFKSDHGAYQITCACRIIHFDGSRDSGWTWDDGELEELVRKSESQPDRYRQHQNAITSVYIDGLEIVHGCSCDLGKKYEQFILSHAEQIAVYLNKTADHLEYQANAMRVKKGIR